MRRHHDYIRGLARRASKAALMSLEKGGAGEYRPPTAWRSAEDLMGCFVRAGAVAAARLAFLPGFARPAFPILRERNGYCGDPADRRLRLG